MPIQLLSVAAQDLLPKDIIVETLLTASQNPRKALVGVVESVVTQLTSKNQALGFKTPTTVIVFNSYITFEKESVEYPQWFWLDILRFSYDSTIRKREKEA